MSDFLFLFILSHNTPKPRDTGLNMAYQTHSIIKCDCGYWCLRNHAKEILIVCPQCNKPFDFRSGFRKFIDKYIKFW